MKELTPPAGGEHGRQRFTFCGKDGFSMSMIFKKHLSRRTFLRGMGVTMSLPLLDAMVPAQTALAQTAAKPQVRLGLCFIPHGRGDEPVDTGSGRAARALADPVAARPHRDQVVVLSNLAHAMAGPQGRRQRRRSHPLSGGVP
jgi:hypothetical protein